MKEYIILQKWDDDFNGGAIYSLVDEGGKRYIGQAIHLQQRLNTHRIELNSAYKGNPHSSEGSKLYDAGRRGVKFHVEVLKKFKWNEVTVNNLRYWEKYYLEKYGGVENTYNSTCVYEPNYSYEPFNDAILELEIKDADILDKLSEVDNMQGYIKKLIREDIKGHP